MTFTITIFLTVLAISFILLTLGLIYKRLFFSLTSAVIFIFLGGSLLLVGITVPSETTSQLTQPYIYELDIEPIAKNNGFYISLPLSQRIKQYTNQILDIHIYTDDGTAINDTQTGCYLHAYNLDGSHAIESELIFDDYDYIYNLNQTFTAETGIYNYRVWCKDDTRNGFSSGIVEVYNDNYKNLSFSLILVLLGIYVLFSAVSETKKNEQQEFNNNFN